jgi:hypothetical protein
MLLIPSSANNLTIAMSTRIYTIISKAGAINQKNSKEVNHAQGDRSSKTGVFKETWNGQGWER